MTKPEPSAPTWFEKDESPPTGKLINASPVFPPSAPLDVGARRMFEGTLERTDVQFESPWWKLNTDADATLDEDWFKDLEGKRVRLTVEELPASPPTDVDRRLDEAEGRLKETCAKCGGDGGPDGEPCWLCGDCAKEIAERAERSLEDPLISKDCYQVGNEDIPWLLSQVAALQAERDAIIGHYSARARELEAAVSKLTQERDEARELGRWEGFTASYASIVMMSCGCGFRILETAQRLGVDTSEEVVAEREPEFLGWYAPPRGWAPAAASVGEPEKR